MLSTNVRSLLPKKDEMSAAVNDSNADIIAVTETWLCDKIRNEELLCCDKKYKIYRCDRPNRCGGGVLLAVNESIENYAVAIDSVLEATWCCLNVAFRKVVIGVCYRPPSGSANFCNDLHDCLSHVKVLFPRAAVILLGDFNFPNIVWSNSYSYSLPNSAEAEHFIRICSDFGLTQLVNFPTRVTDTTSSILDLILTSEPDIVSSVSNVPGISDHDIIQANILLPFSRMRKQLKTIRDYRKADFDSINKDLGTFLDEFLPNYPERSVQSNWDLFKAKVSELTVKHIPIKQVLSNTRAPWYNRYINRLSNRKKRFYRAAVKSPSDKRWSTYKSAATTYLSEVKRAKSSFFSHTLPVMLKNNPRQFWNFVRGSERRAIALLTAEGHPVPDVECASVLNDTFIKAFSHQATINNQISLPSPHYLPMDAIFVTSEGIRAVIKKLKNSSSCGVDGINAKFLKNTVEYSSIILSCIFSQSLQHSSLPEDWLVGKIVPVHKSGLTHNPSNFRPISLTSVPCKILEHIIFTHLVNFLESNQFFTPSQHGFRKNFSCETQLLVFTNDLHVLLDSGFTIDCIFLDYSKAFDKVSHQLLLLKMKHLNLDPNVFNWIRAFLSNRTQFVSANNIDSPVQPVLSGVPQGSVLGPLLFLIFMNDLPTNVSSKVCLFADDCVIYRKITNQNDVTSLQTDLNNIFTWCQLCNMELNISKCKAMRVCRTSLAYPDYHLNDTHLESVSFYKYLGVHISSNLSWNHHVEHIIAKANRSLGYFRRNFYMAPSSLKKLLYTTYIRPSLEYASSVWDPGGTTLTHELEAVQNRSVRFILANYNRTASVTLMKSQLNLPELAIRRKIARLSLLHKLYHSKNLREQFIKPPSFISPRLDHLQKVHVPRCRTVTYSHAFIPRTTSEWNLLPQSATAITDTSRFRAFLQNMFCDV